MGPIRSEWPKLMAIRTVSQVTAHLKQALENDPLLSDLLVEAEVSNLRVSGAGHSYFTLKDDQSVLNCVMFRGKPGADLLRNGDAVLAEGNITFYEPRGTTEFMVEMAMAAGVGELALELERLRQRLKADGLFDQSRKRALPRYPKVIGVVTSPSGAVFHDIQNVVRQRYPLAELLLAPSSVQGDLAAGEIVSAIGRLNEDWRSDVIIVARGGGSLEDLWPFNEESVARAIYASRVPVVSAVGHETDNTVVDDVADVRAATPSVAAELVTPDQAELRHELASVRERFYRSALRQVGASRGDVQSSYRGLERSLPDITSLRRRVDDLARMSRMALTNWLNVTRMSVDNRADSLRALDPQATLRRGFAVVQHHESGRVVSATTHAANGDALSITVADGVIPAIAGTDPTANQISTPQSPPRKRKARKEAPAMGRLF